MEPDDIIASKNSLIREIFVRTADENYVTARWCASNHFNHDFLWLSVHSLEKYIKAVLLSNGLTSKGYDHDIVKLLAELQKLAGPLIPDRLLKPDHLTIANWEASSPQEFFNHLYDNGRAHNRYALYGYITQSQDLHMLDAMVFAIRRLICQLDERVIDSNDRCAPTFTHRDLLTRQPEYFGSMFMPLDNLISQKGDSSQRRALLNLNMAFAPIGYRHKPMRKFSMSSNPVIVRRIFQPLSSKDKSLAAEGIEIANWFLNNVKIPEEDKKTVNVAIRAARKIHPGI